MPHSRTPPQLSAPDATEATTLHELLRQPVPRSAQRTPVALRSVQQQRQFALRGYRVRNWVDAALTHTERLFLALLLLAVLAAGFEWHGRDWLYYRLNPNPPVAAYAPRATHADLAARSVVAPAVVELGAALPYETAAMHTPDYADYIAPRPPLLIPAEPDPRPYRLHIPSIQLDSSVLEVFIERGAWQVADYAIGYHHGSGMPGDAGNVVLAGHAGLRGAVFRDLGRLRAGDSIAVYAGNWVFEYHVRELRHVWPHQTDVMRATERPILTLITCTAWDRQRLVVIADLVGSRAVGQQ
ncbi:MAG: sortase [Chloroflexaceae bacterium]|nr:sortase [Chloroflexaceae bacterium]